MDTMEPIYWRRTNWKGNGCELEWMGVMLHEKEVDGSCQRNWNQMRIVTDVEDMVGSHNGWKGSERSLGGFKENCSTILIALISLLFNLLAFFFFPVTLLFDLFYKPSIISNGKPLLFKTHKTSYFI